MRKGVGIVVLLALVISIAVLAAVPTHDTPVLTATDDPSNTTHANLTLSNQSTADTDGDSVKNIYQWFYNDTPYAIGNLPFEGNGGSESSEAKDYSGFINNASVTGATWNSTGGYDGRGAYEFDGVNDRIDFGSNYYEKLDNFTIMAWVKYVNGSGTNVFRFQRPISAGVDNCGVMNDSEWAYTSGTLKTGNWTHIACVYDGFNLSLFQDGVFANSTTVTKRDWETSYKDSGIGYRPTGVDGFFGGSIDEFLIFNQTLSAEQIALYYANISNILASQETDVGEVWKGNVTPNDGTSDGVSKQSNSITITNYVPTQGKPIIIASDAPVNKTGANLTAVNQSTNDTQEDTITHIYNWRVNSEDYALVNLPFEGDSTSTTTSDYANSFDGTVTGAVFDRDGGYFGDGAYVFNGDDRIDLGTGLFQKLGNFTIAVWFKGSGANLFRFRTPISVNSNACQVYDGGWKSASATSTGANWAFTTCRYNGSSIAIYQNGTYANSVSAGSISWGSYQNAGIGYRPDAGDQLYTGTIASVVIYNKSLSSDQIQALYDQRGSVIASSETSPGDTWQVEVTPSDSYTVGTTNTSDTFTVRASDANLAPIHVTPILNASSGTNLTSENLTVYNQSTIDYDGDSVKNIVDWRVNGSSVAILNLPFEATGGGESSEAKDYSLNSYNGTIINATHNATGGYDGSGAYAFDGSVSSGYLNFSDGTVFPTGNDDFAVSFWIYRNNDDTGDSFYYHYTDFADGDEDYINFRILDTNIIQVFYVIGGASQGTFQSTGTVAENEWAHIVLSRSSNNLSFYINGSASGSVTLGSITDHTGGVWIGKGAHAGDSTRDQVNGTLDEYRIWNRSLSSEQILALYNNRTDLIVSDETSGNDTWQACITPNDGIEDGTERCSNTITITVPDTTNPSVANLVPVANTQVNVSQSVEIAANVTDDSEVDTVFVNLTLPNGTVQQITLTNASGNEEFNGTFTTPNIQGQYNITFIANDTSGNVNNSETTYFVINSSDIDMDGVVDEIDNVVGNESNVTTSGVTSLNVTVGGNATNASYVGEYETLFYDSATLLVNFTHNYSSSSQINMSQVSIVKTSTSLVVNFSGQVSNKTLYLVDDSFISLCVKDEEIASVSEISSGCTGGNETDFTSCIGNSSGVTLNGTTCIDNGTRFIFQNLNFSGVRGGQASGGSSGGSSGGGGGGGGGRSLTAECNDRRDNDGDGLVDLNDPDCYSLRDPSESPSVVVEENKTVPAPSVPVSIPGLQQDTGEEVVEEASPVEETIEQPAVVEQTEEVFVEPERVGFVAETWLAIALISLVLLFLSLYSVRKKKSESKK